MPRKERNTETLNAHGDPRPTSGNSTGNPPKNGIPYRQFDQRIFENLCKCQCTLNEICAIFQCDDSTINGWCKRTYGERCSDAIKRFSMGGHASLRRTQFNLAQKNAAMAIWLGKQYLGQKENVEDLAEKVAVYLNRKLEKDS